MTTTPAVGQTVHYTDNPVAGGGHARCFDAEVTWVNQDGTLDVQESLPDGTSPAYGISEGEPGDLYTWHWPEPTETSTPNELVDVAAAEESGTHWSEAVSWHPMTDAGAVAPAASGPAEEATSTAAPASPDCTQASTPYPYPDGDVIVLGPETFKALDGSVISHKGENYYPTSVVITSSEVGEGTHAAEPTEGERETNSLLHHITVGDFL